MVTVKKMLKSEYEDAHPYASFALIPILPGESLLFKGGADHNGQPCQQMVIEKPIGPPETHDLAGKVYILSDSGKTIATHGG